MPFVVQRYNKQINSARQHEKFIKIYRIFILTKKCYWPLSMDDSYEQNQKIDKYILTKKLHCSLFSWNNTKPKVIFRVTHLECILLDFRRCIARSISEMNFRNPHSLKGATRLKTCKVCKIKTKAICTRCKVQNVLLITIFHKSLEQKHETQNMVHVTTCFIVKTIFYLTATFKVLFL